MKNIVHWCMQKKMWTSHTYKSCTKAESILIMGDWSTEIKPRRRTNPRGWVVTDHRDVWVNPPSSFLNLFIKSDRLVYNKDDMSFSIQEGNFLLFDNDGCYTLRRGEEFEDKVRHFVLPLRNSSAFSRLQQQA